MPALLQTIAVGLLGATVLDRLKVPAGVFIGAMLGVACLRLLGNGVATSPPGSRFIS